MGISVQAKTLLLSAWRKQTSSSYDSAWRKWCGWCDKQQINPLHASIQHVVNFLAHHFEAEKEYRTINVCQSALSATLPKLDGFSAYNIPWFAKL
jgi:site-specific recombinase XerD